MGMQALENHIGFLKRRCAAMPDKRTGNSARHTMADAGMAAFAVFFTQCPSFLAAPRELELRCKRSNALFALDSIPTDNHIRNLLEDTLEQGGLATMQRRKGHTLIALDGTGSFRSRKISCPNCSRQKMADGHQQYVHRMLAATRVAPGHATAPPNSSSPRTGPTSRTVNATPPIAGVSASAAASRRPVCPGDALFAGQPLAARIKARGADFLLVVKPKRHQTLDKQVDRATHCRRRTVTRGKGNRRRLFRYRWCNTLPLRADDDAMPVNGLERVIENPRNGHRMRFAFITSLDIDA